MILFYFIKQTLLLGVFYLIYKGILQLNKTFKWNRAYILLAVVVSMILPFFEGFAWLHKSLPASTAQPLAYTLETIQVYANGIKPNKSILQYILWGMYLLGFCWGLFRLLLGFFVIRRIRLQSRLVKYKEDLLYFHEGIDSPFSFLQNMYIPMMYRQHPMLDNIVLHERAHIQYKHSYDKIMFSILQALFWFNPFLYLFHKEMELLHEFQADDITAQEMETEHYVDNLLHVIRYTKTPTMLAHHFFSHPLKNRILMLYKTATPARLQKIAALALTFLGCSAFLFMQSNAQVKKKASYYVQTFPQDTVDVENPVTGEIRRVLTLREPDTIYNQVDRMPEFIGGQPALVDYLIKHVQFPESAKQANIEGKVIVQFVVRSTGEIDKVKVVKSPLHGEALSQEALRVVSSMPRWLPGVQSSKPVSVEFTLPIDFRLSK